MTPPPPLPPAAGADAPDESLPAVARSVEELASFSDRLTDFLDQWNHILVHANSIAAALPPLADPDQERKPSPKTVGVAEPGGQSSSVLVDALAAVTDRVAESNPKPDPATQLKPDGVLHQRNDAAAGFPVPEPEPVLSAVVEPNQVPEPDPEPAPKAKPTAERERRAGEPSEAALGTICEQMGSRSLRHRLPAWGPYTCIIWNQCLSLVAGLVAGENELQRMPSLTERSPSISIAVSCGF